jgi:adenine/guanine phosphoribosyltransferase-like PRPP-binding protein
LGLERSGGDGSQKMPGIFSKSEKVLLVDELIETGAQVKAAIQLIEGQAATISAITGIAMEQNERTKDLFQKHRCRPLTDGKTLGL